MPPLSPCTYSLINRVISPPIIKSSLSTHTHSHSHTLITLTRNVTSTQQCSFTQVSKPRRCIGVPSITHSQQILQHHLRITRWAYVKYTPTFVLQRGPISKVSLPTSYKVGLCQKYAHLRVTSWPHVISKPTLELQGGPM